jgi:hypothetical protein
VGNILRRHNIAPAPDRSRTTSWKEFIRSHMEVLAAADFFTVEVLKWRGLVTYYIRFHRSRHPPSIFGRHHEPPRRRLDGTSGAQRHHAGQRLSEWLPLPVARSRPEVLPRVSGDACGGWREVPTFTSQKSQSERLRGTLGTFDQRGMPTRVPHLHKCVPSPENTIRKPVVPFWEAAIRVHPRSPILRPAAGSRFSARTKIEKPSQAGQRLNER